MPATGEVTEGREGFEWRVTGLRSLREDVLYWSPHFSFSGEEWYLRMSVITLERRRSGRIELRLRRRCFGPALHVEFTLSVKSINGQRHGEGRRTKEFDGYMDYLSGVVPLSLDEQVMLEMENEDVLTVVCQLRIIDPIAGASQSNAQLELNATGSTSVQRQLAGEQSRVMQLKRQVADVEGERHKRQRLLTSATESASQSNEELEEKATVSTSVQTELPEEQSEIVQLKHLVEELTLKVAEVADKLQSSITSATGSDSNQSALPKTRLHHDLRQLFLDQEDCDVVIRVKGREFKAHSQILKARSPALASTFWSDLRERGTGTVNIEDLDPTTFQDFLSYLYCDEVDNLSEQNVFSLYTAANKYDVSDLKAMCVAFIKQNL